MLCTSKKGLGFSISQFILTQKKKSSFQLSEPVSKVGSKSENRYQQALSEIQTFDFTVFQNKTV